MNNRNSLAHKSIATAQEERKVREYVVRKLKRQKPLAETVSIQGIRFPKDWRSRQNDLLSETP